MIKQRSYLSRFLVKVDVPPEFLSDPETLALYERYQGLIEDFKMAHKEREAGKKGGEAAAELKSDLKDMEKEREVILDRVDKIKSRAESNLHLLQAAHELRVERDRDHELSMQKIQEKETLSSLQLSIQRTERKLEILKEASVELSSELLEQRLNEEVMILTAVRHERLPAELTSLKSRVDALKSVCNSNYVGPDEIIKLRQKLDAAAREVQALAEETINQDGVEKMAPFRQQAAAISSCKKNTLERLDETEAYLTNLKKKLEEKKEQQNDNSVPKGEELKKYVARLKTKSLLYKKCRGELSGLKAEAGVLSRTLSIIEGKMAGIKAKESDEKAGGLPDGFTEGTAVMANMKLSKEIGELKTRVTSILTELQPLRQQAQDIEERYDRAKKSHESIETSVRGTITNLSNEVESLQLRVDKDTEEIKRLKNEIIKFKEAQEKIQQEIRFYANPGVGQSLRDKLSESISAEEKKLKALKAEEKNVKEHGEENKYQTNQWNNLISIFESKLQQLEENKRRDGIVVRKEGAETLILQ
ncbi:intraflagellar transport protein 81 homolog isoform X2 [Aphidius gifuensis]|nr:intraflagellar transport protein 81 homolog isoform X2 [Aphidius gifuensis]XP_044010035.1 intraflagellar transport protein 81 homolog isoform X2 [Aphidius gifuensis]